MRNLKKMFQPQAICLLGAEPNATSLGYQVLKNLMAGDYQGPVMPVSQVHRSLNGVLTYPDLGTLPLKPDLAICCLKDDLIKQTLNDCADNGIHHIVLMGQTSHRPPEFISEIKQIARARNLKVLGPNALGFCIPSVKINASSFHIPVAEGKVAYVAQSGAMTTSVLDWANAHNVGFSHFISLGACAETGFGDVIDYLGSDPFTRAILLHMDGIDERRNFMSAARASARNKPVLVIKTGKFEKIALGESTHTSVLAGTDLVYDAAFRRAGMLRVNSTGELFAAAETLSRSRPFKGNRLAIVSNGSGLNMIAHDHLYELNGKMVTLSEETLEKIKAIVGEPNLKNPVDIGAHCPPEAYGQVYEVLDKAKEVDCILFLHAPHNGLDSLACAQSLINAYKKNKGNLITCWVGEHTVRNSQRLFEANQIATYYSVRMAIISFMHIVNYVKNQKTLMETPEHQPASIRPHRQKAREIIDNALKEGHTWLREFDAKAILQAYGIEVVQSHFVTTEDEAAQKSSEIGFPVVVKIVSDDIIHKSDVGGVVLSLNNEEAVKSAINLIRQRVETFKPGATINGFILQKMIHRPHAHEVIAGMKNDPVFGPVILFGEGGVATEIIADRAVALPPLNMGLAGDLISRTKISKLLGGYRDHPPADLTVLKKLLIELSEICIDFPEIQEFDVNPILASSEGALAVDVRIRIEANNDPFPNRRLAVRPYPAQLEETFTMRNGRNVLIRPIKPEDEPDHVAFLKKISPEDIRFRFFGSVRELPHTELARMTQIDYDREMAFVAQAQNEETGQMETMGVVRTATDPYNDEAEYAILVRSDLKGQKLGWKLLNKMIEYCRSRGTAYFTGQILRENRTMIDMVKAMGFETRIIVEEDIVEVRLKLQSK